MASFAISELEAYQRQQQEETMPLSDAVHKRVETIPYESIGDFVATTHAATQSPLSPFLWPSESTGFDRDLPVALHRLPPDRVVSVAN